MSSAEYYPQYPDEFYALVDEYVASGPATVAVPKPPTPFGVLGPICA